MRWLTILWSMAGGSILAIAGMHFIVWIKDRGRRLQLVFSLWAASSAFSALLELVLMHARTPEQFGETLRWIHLPYAASLVFYLWLIRLYLQAGRPWLMGSIYGLNALALIVNFLSGPNIDFSRITALRPYMIWGERTVVPIGVAGPWEWISEISWILTLVFIIDAVIVSWRRGRRRQAKVMGSVLFVISALTITMAYLAIQGNLPMPISMSLPSLIPIMLIAYELSRELVHARLISRKLEWSQDRVALAASAANLVLWEWDVVRDRIWAVEPGGDRVGVREAEPLGSVEFFRSVHPDDRELTQQAGLKALESGEEFDVEYRVVAPEGSVRWKHSCGRLARDPRGKPVVVRGVTMDVTDRKVAESRIKEGERRLKEAQHIAHLGNWELDLTTNTLNWSDEIFRIFEKEKGEFGASYEAFLEAVHPEDRSAVNAAYTKSLETGTPYKIVHRILTPDGRTKFVEEQCETICDPGGKPLRSVGTVQDITESKQAESDRIELRNELAHLNRVMTMGVLSASIAHEINQPLGAILNNAAAAKIIYSKQRNKDAEIVEILADIIRDSTRAGEVLRKIRGIVKKEVLEPETLDMNVLIDNVVELFQNSFNLKRVTLQLDPLPGPAPVIGDRIRLQQVLTNLITNALEAMQDSPLKLLRIRTVRRSPDLIIVSVSDSGAGIDQAIRDRLFKSFVTMKKEGLGMGLYICQSILEDYGGRIWAEPHSGSGATFAFSLPLSDPGGPAE